jgi:hypothetical protein
MPPLNPPRRSVLAGLALAAGGLDAASAPVDRADARRTRAEPRPKEPSYEVLEVGPGKRFASLTLAGCFMNSDARWNNGQAGPERIARMGFRVVISPGPPGYYVNDSGSHSRRWKEMVGWPPYEGGLLGPVVIEGERGKPAPVLETDGYGDGVLYYQTGLFATGNFDATFRNLVFKGFRRQDGQGNYAAIRLGQRPFEQTPLTGRVLIEDCEFSACDDGILGGSPGQRLMLRRCYFHDNGNETGRTHNIYVGAVDELAVEELLSTRCTIGHLLKTRAAKTTIRNSRLLGGGGTESACLDVPNGGVLEIDGLVCEKSEDSDAHWIIHYGGENQDDDGLPFHKASQIRIRDLTLIAPPRLRRHPSWPEVVGFANQSGDGPETSGRGSRFVPVQAADVRVHGLTVKTAGLPCRVLAERPPIDARPPVRA